MTPEQKQQLERIREQRAEAAKRSWMDHPPQPTWRDIDFLLSLVKSQEAGDDISAFNRHLAERHEELAAFVRQECSKAVDLIEQYTRPDFYMWLLHDYAGQKSDPYKRAAEAKQVLQGLLASKPSERSAAVANDAAASMRSACVEKVKALRKQKAMDWYGDDVTEKQIASYMITPDEIITALESVSIQE